MVQKLTAMTPLTKSMPACQHGTAQRCAPCVEELVWVKASNGAACEVAHAVHAALVTAHVVLDQALNDAVCRKTVHMQQSARGWILCTNC